MLGFVVWTCCCHFSRSKLSKEDNMETKIDQTEILEIEIEELETKIAPDGGETVLPL
jgi:hypothetical protein